MYLKGFWNFNPMPNDNTFSAFLCFQSLGKKTGLSGAVASRESSASFNVPFLSLNFYTFPFLSDWLFFFFLFQSPSQHYSFFGCLCIFFKTLFHRPLHGASHIFFVSLFFMSSFYAFCLLGFLLLEKTLSAIYFLFIVLLFFVVRA